jgi:Bacterial pre-peptidase C-terminal domain
MVEYAGSKFSSAIGVSLTENPVTLNNRLGQFHPIYFYKFNVSNRSNFNSVLNGLSKDADLALYNNSEREIATSRNRRTAQDAILRQLDPGTYYIRVNRRDQDTNFTLQLSTSTSTSTSTVDVVNPLPENVRVSRGKRNVSYQGLVNTSDNTQPDVYRFRLSRPTQLTSQLDRLTGNANLKLFKNDQRIAFSDRSGTKSETIDRMLEAGRYSIQVGIRNGSSQYRLRLSFSSPTADRSIHDSARSISGTDLFH